MFVEDLKTKKRVLIEGLPINDCKISLPLFYLDKYVALNKSKLFIANDNKIYVIEINESLFEPHPDNEEKSHDVYDSFEVSKVEFDIREKIHGLFLDSIKCEHVIVALETSKFV